LKYQTLGKTGILVSPVALGTTALGMDYGINAPGDYGRPTKLEAIRLLHQSSDAGINLFDTAPVYGESERLIGQAIGRRNNCHIATKVSVPADSDGKLLDGAKLKQTLLNSIENSLLAMQRDFLDIVQIHNATTEVINRGEILEILLQAQKQGKLRFIGASVYGEDAALEVIKSGCFDMLQVAYNMLDQRMARRVFPAAEHANVGIITRSVFLKGALTPKAQWLPQELAPLRYAAERAKTTLTGSWEALPQVALRYCLSTPQVATVLAGIRTLPELIKVLEAVAAGPLPAEVLAQTPKLALAEEYLLNPSYWDVP